MWELPPQPTGRRRRLVGLGVLAAIGVAVLAATIIYVVHGLWPTIGTSNATRQELPTIQAMPEATLLAPGSHIFGRHTSSATVLGGGASINTVAGSNESDQQIFAYLRIQLSLRGWKGPNPDGVDSPTWTHGSYEFFLSFDGPGEQAYPGESQYATTYTVGVAYLQAPTSTTSESPEQPQITPPG